MIFHTDSQRSRRQSQPQDWHIETERRVTRLEGRATAHHLRIRALERGPQKPTLGQWLDFLKSLVPIAIVALVLAVKLWHPETLPLIRSLVGASGGAVR